MTIFARDSILDVWQGSEQASWFLPWFYEGYTGIIDVCQTDDSIHSKLGIFSLFWSTKWKYSIQANEKLTLFWSDTWKYSIQANERSTKVKEKLSTIQFDIFFIPMSQTVSILNRSGTCYFLHASNDWRVCWRVRVQSHASNGKVW